MAAETPAGYAAPALSPRLARILAPDGPPFGRPVLKPEELDEIRAVLRAGDTGKLNLSRAMFVLFDNDPSEDSAALIGAVLTDPRRRPALRRQAAAVLGEAPSRAGSAALAAALGEADAALEFTILAALARTGEPAAADAIARRPPATLARLEQMRRYARAAILFRAGAAPDDATEAALFPRGRVAEVTPLKPEALALILRTLRGNRFGLTLGAAFGFGFVCGQTRHAVLFDAALTPGKLMSQALERRRIAGLIAVEHSGAPVWTTRHAVFLRPDGEGAEVAVARADGAIVLRGRLTRSGKTLALSLRDFSGERIPTEIEGALTDKALTLRARVYDDAPRPKNPGLSEDAP